MSIACVFRFSRHWRQDFQTGFRDPRIPGHDVFSKLGTQKTVCLYLTDNAHEIAKLGRGTI